MRASSSDPARSSIPTADDVSVAWLRDCRRELLGRTRARPQLLPDWVSHPGRDASSVTNTTVTADATITVSEDHRAFTQHRNGTSVREMEENMHKMLELWSAGDYGRMRNVLGRTVDDLLAFETRQPIMYFFAMGGLDLFMRFLCEPPTFTARMSPARDPRADFIAILGEVTRVLFDNVTDCPELSWHIYDRYPGAIYRLLDLMTNPRLASGACSLLEQIVSDIGPVLEVARNPAVARTLQSEDTMVFTCGCRILALLLMPGISMGFSPFSHRRLTTREMVRPYKRLQRVTDSNVLWMLGEEGLLERLIQLSEKRPTKRSERMRDRITAEEAAQPVLSEEDMASLTAFTVAAQTSSTPAASTLARLVGGAMSAVQRLTGQPGRADPARDLRTAELLRFFQEMQSRTGAGGGPGAQPTTAAAANEASAAGELALGTRVGGGASPSAGATSTRPGSAPAAGDEVDEEEDEFVEPMNSPTTASASTEGNSGDEWEDVEEDEDAGTTEDSAGAAVGGWPAGPEEEGEIYNEEGELVEPMNSPPTASASTEGNSGDEWEDVEEESAGPAVGGGPEGAEEGPEEEGEFYDEEEAEDDEAISGSDWDHDEEDGAWSDGAPSETDEYAEGDPDDGLAKRSFKWLFGSVDTRERWRLREPTLLRETDDNRPRLYGNAHTPEDVKRFYERDRKALTELRAFSSLFPNPYQAFETEDNVFASQTETLYLLNAILSTFYFSTPWKMLKECNWLKRASAIVNLVFSSNEEAALPGRSPPETRLTWREMKLPRFLTFSRKGIATEVTASAPRREGDPAVMEERPQTLPVPLPNGYVLPPQEIYGRGSRAAYASDHSTTGVFHDDEFYEPKEGIQSPDTVRKLELLRGVHEFWNAQDRYESARLSSPEIVSTSASIAKKVARVVVSGHADCDVDMNAFALLEIYLRAFSRLHGPERGHRSAPQTKIGRIVLGHIFRERIYNAARIPGLPGSLNPRCRMESMNGMLAETLWYHYGNLHYLCSFVRGSVELAGLNAPSPVALPQGHTVDVRSSREAAEARVRAEPPLAREEHEPFASVLLRRIYRYGFESHHLVRVLVLSLTPGLRSLENYVAKGLDRSVKPWRLAFTERTPSQDYVTGNLQRMTFVRRTSLAAAVRVSLAAAGPTAAASPARRQADVQLEVERLVRTLCRAPHRLPLQERAFPDLFDEYDLSVARGTAEPPPAGPPPELVRPLFDSMIEAVCLRALAPLTKILLAEPHRLVFSLMRSIDADAVEDIIVVGAITTSLAVLMREGKLHGMRAGVRRVLEAIRPLARTEYEAWRAEVEAGRRRTEVLRRYPTVDASCTCDVPASYAADTPDLEGTYRCSTFTLFGSCMPESTPRMYFQHFGGCFYRNYFRVLCVWIAHYASCQRYTEAVYYCTEVPFAEFKNVCMCVIGELPKYFQEPLLYEETSPR